MPEENKNKEKEIGYIKPREITDEMQESYLDYAMSVIISRALPDVRDGLKPVHRRILYAMNEMGLKHNVKFRKSATVVGEVLGKFHPHGDAAVYDSLVRMAQDFSLRYPLIQGQGNFGCFTQDTKVKLTDGRNLSFEELVNEHKAGKKNFTYTVNNLGLISIAEIKNPRMTIKQAKLVKVVLDNEAEIRCTPNHLFMLKNGKYKEARLLAKGESLMPFYQRTSKKTDCFNREGYILIYQNKKDEWSPVHHSADNYNLTIGKYKKNKGRVRHHIDFNKLNNNPDNIIRMHWQQHWQVHYEHASQQHKNEEYRIKIAKGRNRYWSNPINKEARRRALSIRNIRNWQNPQYRERMRVMLSEINKKYIAEHPEKRKELSKRATKTLKRLWRNPMYRSIFHEKIVKGNKNHITNETGKLKFLKVCQELSNKKLIIDEENYNKLRNSVYPYGCATSWQTGLSKYFQNNSELIYQEINKNHKVVKVEQLSYLEDVYDLTINNSHNFCLAAGVFVHNSIDGDAASAMRYSEAKLSAIGEETLRDIEKDTVDFRPNYDGTRKEPSVLPSPLPQLLLNGSLGIAVGMATNIPPHNLAEIVDAAIYLADHPSSTTEDLFRFVQGPDFPTGGIIYGRKDIVSAYSQGKGPILVRGKAEIKETTKGPQIIISEIPFQVSKSELVKQLAQLVETKKVDGIRNIQDLSDKDGMRIEITLKKEGYPRKVLNALYKYTFLQKTFHLNMLALVDGLQPKILSLSDVLGLYLNHKKEIVTRRIKFDLARAKEREHILEGLVIALKNIDDVIATIKKSNNRDEAHKKLRARFKLSALQANAILEMRLQSLAKLEREKIEQELKELKAKIKELASILASALKIKEVVKKELQELKEKYGDARKTKVTASSVGEIGEAELIPQEETIITLTAAGYIKRLKPGTFKVQHRGGKGITGAELVPEDLVEHFVLANTLDNLFFFTDSGKVFQLRAWEIPETSRTSKGRGLLNFLELGTQDKILNILSCGEKEAKEDAHYLIFATKNGIIKKTKLSSFKNVRRSGLIALRLEKGDVLRGVAKLKDGDEIILTTKKGKAIRFKEKDARSMGRQAAGVKGIKLAEGDEVVGGVDVIEKSKSQMPNAKNKEYLLVIMENGYGKRTKLNQYRVQRRGGTGIKTARVTQKTGEIVFSRIVGEENQDLIVISRKGQVIRSPLKSVSIIGRAASGVRIMRLGKEDKVASAICL